MWWLNSLQDFMFHNSCTSTPPKSPKTFNDFISAWRDLQSSRLKNRVLKVLQCSFDRSQCGEELLRQHVSKGEYRGMCLREFQGQSDNQREEGWKRETKWRRACRRTGEEKITLARLRRCAWSGAEKKVNGVCGGKKGAAKRKRTKGKESGEKE